MKVTPVLLSKEFSEKTRLRLILDVIERVGSAYKAPKYLISPHTKDTYTYCGLRALVNRHGYKLAMKPCLVDKNNKIITKEDL